MLADHGQSVDTCDSVVDGFVIVTRLRCLTCASDASSTGRTPRPTGQLRVQLPQPVQSDVAELLGVDLELVVDPLPLPLRTGRCAGCGPRRAA